MLPKRMPRDWDARASVSWPGSVVYIFSRSCMKIEPAAGCQWLLRACLALRVS